MRALIFDLDGTLVDTVYAHIFAWQKALAEAGIAIEGWRIHRKIGMSGGLFTRAVARELGREISPAEEESLQQRHGELFRQLAVTPQAVEAARREKVFEALAERLEDAPSRIGRGTELDKDAAIEVATGLGTALAGSGGAAR